jgi:HAD superfamily hydrolase (TIGR01509 family)
MSLIIFDFDGAIADSLEVFLEATNRLAKDFGYPQVSLAQIPQIKNLSSREMIQQLAIARWKMPFFLRRFRQELNQLTPNLQLVDGMRETLEDISQQGYRLGIVTSNARQNVERFLHIQGLNHLFEFIYAGQVLLGKARVLRQLVKRYRVDLRQVICVGDETRDIEAAQQAGLRIIAVSWGLNSREVLAKHAPDVLIDRPEELLAAVTQVHM